MNMTDPRITETENEGMPAAPESEPITCENCKENEAVGEMFICKECLDNASSCDLTALERKQLLKAVRLALAVNRDLATILSNPGKVSPAYYCGQIQGILEAALKSCER